LVLVALRGVTQEHPHGDSEKLGEVYFATSLSPARELLADMLLEMGRPADALAQFEATLSKEPRRFRSLYGAAHAAKLSGNRDTSLRYHRALLIVCVHSDKPGRLEVREAREAVAKRKVAS
jgi:hypothetical protein